MQAINFYSILQAITYVQSLFFVLMLHTDPPAIRRTIAGDHAGKRAILKHVYTAEIGVRELTGNNDGRSVEAYLRYTGLRPGSPWCAAFVCWALGKAGIENPRSGWSPDLFPAKNLVWKRSRAVNSKPKDGAFATGNVFGIWFPEKSRIAHVGFIDQQHGYWAITVEGNTNLAGSREGDGVYRKRRLIATLYAVADWTKE